MMGTFSPPVAVDRGFFHAPKSDTGSIDRVQIACEILFTVDFFFRDKSMETVTTQANSTLKIRRCLSAGV